MKTNKSDGCEIESMRFYKIGKAIAKKEDMMEENKSDLAKYYKFVYVCKCGIEYGSDKREKGKHVCPKCEKKLK